MKGIIVEKNFILLMFWYESQYKSIIKHSDTFKTFEKDVMDNILQIKNGIVENKCRLSMHVRGDLLQN